MRVAVTQRVEIRTEYNERRDCLDQAWTTLLSQIGCDIVLVPNRLSDINVWLKKQRVEALLLTGGNDLSHLAKAFNPAPERDAIEEELLKWAAKYKIPVLGVCRGMQKLNHFLAGSLSPIKNHVNTKHIIFPVKNEVLCSSFSFVNSYHSWGIKPEDLSSNLRALALAEDGTIEALAHIKLPWVGIMWHPERENASEDKNNITLIKKVFFDLNKKFK